MGCRVIPHSGSKMMTAQRVQRIDLVLHGGTEAGTAVATLSALLEKSSSGFSLSLNLAGMPPPARTRSPAETPLALMVGPKYLISAPLIFN